jgi:hypothetical protein
MFGSAKCPVSSEEQAWIDEQMAWLMAEFGPGPLECEPLLPTAEHFPGPFTGSEQEIVALVTRLCHRMGVDPAGLTIEVEPEDGEDEMVTGLNLARSSRSAAGHYRREGGRPVIAVDQRQAARPVALVATIAHELGHVRLLDERRITTDRRDHEPLTDLLTVHFGVGVLSANAAFTFTQDNRRWGYQRLGYLTQQMYGYALARYARARGEQKPAWARYLDTNPRAYLKQSLRHLGTDRTR